MKKHFSLLLAVLFALVLGSQVASAQSVTGSLGGPAGTYDWQQDVTWGLVNNWPGRNAPGGVDTAYINNAVAYTIQNVPPSNPIGVFIITPGANVLLNGTGTLRIASSLVVGGNLSIGAGLTVQVDGVISGGAAIQVNAGGTLRVNNTSANAIGANVTLQAQNANGIISFGPGYNAGVFPFSAFLNQSVLATLQINGDMSLSGPLSIGAAGGGFNLVAGTFTVKAGQTLRLGNTGTNTFIGTTGLMQAEPLGVVEINAGFNASNLPGSRFASPFTGTMSFVGATVYNLQQTMVLGPGAGGNGGVLAFQTAGGAINVNAGTTLRLLTTQPNAITGPTAASAHLQTSLGGTIEVGAGFNAGVIPFTRFTAIQGTFRNLAPLQVNINGANVDPFAGSASGIWDMQGDITLVGTAGSLSLTATPVGTLAGPGKFIAQNTSQFVNFGTGANGGNIPVGKFTSPYVGSLGISTSFNLVPSGGVSKLDLTDGQFSFRNAANAVLTIQGNTELRLGRSTVPAIVGNVPATSYIQGVSSTSVLTLGTGFNGGAIPLPATSFLPLPTSTPDGFFRGRLQLEGSLSQARGIVFGSSSSLVLGSIGVPANFTTTGATGATGITLGMTAPNSLSGTGVLQGNNANTSSITLGTGFNNGVIPGKSFAQPFLGSLLMNGTGPMQLQDSLIIGQNGAGAVGALGLATATDVLTLRPNSLLRINGTGAADMAALGNGTALGYVQGTDTTSVLMFGTGALAGQVRGLAGPGATPPSQFNGMLYTFGGAMTLPGAAPGNSLSIGTPGGWINDATFTAPAATNVVLNNIGLNSFRGVGTVQGAAATATYNLGPGFNGGGGANPAIIPGFRFATNFAGTLAHPTAPSRLTGVLQFAPIGALPGLLTMPAGSQMTIDPNAILTLRSTGADPSFDPINNTGTIQGADNTSILRLGPTAGDFATIHASNIASPFNGRLDMGIAAGSGRINFAAAAPKPLVNALTLNTGSILNLQANITVTAGGGASALNLNMNQPNSFIGSATGYLTADVPTTSVRLGTGFNGGDLPGRLFGTASALGGFTGSLLMNSGNLNLSSSLSVGATSFMAFNSGTLTVADGSTLTLPGGANVTRVAVAGSNNMCATSSAGVVRTTGTGAANLLDGNFFCNPFPGRINYEGAAGNISNALTIGDLTGTNGVLATSVALAINGGANLTLNNKAPQGIVLPGISGVAGQLSAAAANATLTLGDGATGAAIPVTAMTAALPFAGVLRTTAPTQMTLDASGAPNSAFSVAHLNLGANVLVASGSSLGLTGTLSDRSTLPATGYIQGVDNTSTVSLAAAFGGAAPGVANSLNPRAGAVNACQFGALGSSVGFNQAAGFNGTFRTAANLTIDCRLTIGNPGGSFGILDIAAGTSLSIPQAAISIGAAASGTGPFGFGARSVVLNNISPLATVLPNTGVIDIFGDATNTMDPTGTATQALFNGDANLGNGTLVIGPGPSGAGAGALGGTIPGTRIATAGGFSQVRGTIISSSGTYTMNQNMSFTAAGRLILGGAAASNTVSLNGFTVIMNNTRYDAVTGGTVGVNPAPTGLAISGQLYQSLGPANYTSQAAGTLLIPAGSSFGMAANFQSANNQLGGLGTFNAAVLGNNPVAGTIAAAGGMIQSGAMTVSGSLSLTAAAAVWRIGTTATFALDGVNAANRGVINGTGFIAATTGNVTVRSGSLSVVAPNVSRGRFVLTNAPNNNLVPFARMTGVNGAAASPGIGLAGLTVAGSALAASIAVPVYSTTGLSPIGQTVGFDGDLVLENGAISLAAANGLAIASAGGVEMNGSLIVNSIPTTLALNNTAGAAASVLGLPQAASFRARSGNTLGSATFPTIRFEPTVTPNTSSIVIGNGFNGGQLPIMSFGVVGGTGNLTRTTANGGTFQFEGPGGATTAPAGTLAMNTLPGLPAASTAVVDWGGSGTTIGSRLRLNNGLYTSIPANLQWNLNVTTAAPAGITFAGNPRSGFLGTDLTSILNLTTTGAPSALDLQLGGTAAPAGPGKPSIGASGFQPFNGLLRLSNGFSLVANETVTIGTPGGLDLAPGALTVGQGGILNLNNTTAGSMRPVVANPTPTSCTTSSPVYGAGTGSQINLGAGFNGGFVDANNFNLVSCAVTPPTRSPLNASLRQAAAGNLNLRNRLILGAQGAFDFVGTGRTFTIGTDTLESQVNGFLNGGNTSYFLTNSTGVVQIGSVGTQNVPLGTTYAGTNTYAPITLNFAGAPDAFRVRVLPGPPSPATPRIGFVDLQWLVSKANTAAGGALTTSVQWPSLTHRNGFSPNVAIMSEAVGGAYPNTVVSAASPLANNYFTTSRTTSNVPNNTVYAVFSDPTPTLTSVTNTQRPSILPSNTGYQGDTVTVNGINIAAVSSVTFNGVNATIVSQSSTGVRVIVPGNLPVTTPVTFVPVVVTQSGGSATIANGFGSLGSLQPLPVITNITPNPVPSGLGDVVVNIAGTSTPGFGSLGLNVQVSSGGNPGAATVLSAGPTLVSVRVPAAFVSVPGTLTLTVRSSDRQQVSGTVPVAASQAPNVSALIPSSTTASLQAFTLRILGKNFALGSLVTYGTAQTPLTVTALRLSGSATVPDTLLVTFPASANVVASAGNVTVRNLDGQSGTIPFTVNRGPAPVILALSPSQVAPGSAAFTLAIQGTGFQQGATVRFSDQPVTVLSNNGTEIRVAIPASLVATQGLLVVKVTNVDGQEVGARFPVTGDNVPVGPITGINPATLQSTPNAVTIVLSGSNLGNVGSAVLGSTPLQVAGVSANGLTLVIPAGAAVNNGTSPLSLLLTVSNTGGNSTSRPITIFPAGTAPAISTIAPASNTRNAGQVITLTIVGDNFVAGAVVRLIGLKTDTFTPTSVSLNQIVVNIPSNVASGQYTLQVVNPDTQVAAQPYGLLTPTGTGTGGGTGGTFNPNPGAGTVETSVRINDGVSMSVYPNPVLETVTVDARFEKPATVTIRVTNVLGQDVLVPATTQVGAGAFTKQLNVSSLPAGTYTVDVTDGTNRTVKQIVKN
jgi:hypothetical protein